METTRREFFAVIGLAAVATKLKPEGRVPPGRPGSAAPIRARVTAIGLDGRTIWCEPDYDDSKAVAVQWFPTNKTATIEHRDRRTTMMFKTEPGAALCERGDIILVSLA